LCGRTHVGTAFAHVKNTHRTATATVFFYEENRDGDSDLAMHTGDSGSEEVSGVRMSAGMQRSALLVVSEDSRPDFTHTVAHGDSSVLCIFRNRHTS
jgi:hypothetical protein